MDSRSGVVSYRSVMVRQGFVEMSLINIGTIYLSPARSRFISGPFKTAYLSLEAPHPRTDAEPYRKEEHVVSVLQSQRVSSLAGGRKAPLLHFASIPLSHVSNICI
ncbi:hypothetical protein NPIL_5641 [Nephila pilipes]|uniref:Uncharacterized protein n=1 Tax=Nephila pilipes TaxID=299642 RepID=A0A8X6MV37_NEPPI|nr:hypothetical protein NPIL_5641 [Nephila pilipes]